MKKCTFILAALVIGGAFSFLLTHIASQEREIARQREQIAVMRETSEQAREAFQHIRFTPYWGSRGTWTRGETFYSEDAFKSLDAEIETMETVSRER